MALFLFLLWVVYSQPSKTLEPMPRDDLTVTPKTQTAPLIGAPLTRNDGASTRPTSRGLNPMVVVDFEDSKALTIFFGFKKNFRKTFQTIDVKKLGDYSRQSDLLFIAIGSKALEALGSERLNQPQFFLSAEPNQNIIVDPADQRYGIFATIPEQYEWVVLRRLLPELKTLILVFKPGIDPPKESVFRDWPYEIDIFAGGTAQLTNALANSQPKDALVWLQDFSPSDVVETRLPSDIRGYISFVGIDEFSKKSDGLEKVPPFTYFSLRLNPEGLGKQGARLVEQFLSGSTIEAIDQYPQEAFDVVLHLGGVSDSKTLEAITAFEIKVKALGFPIRYQ